MLDTKADTLLFDIDIKNLGFDRIALLVVIEHFLAGQAPVKIGKVNQAVYFARQTDEQTELGDVLDLALNQRVGRMQVGQGLPGIAHALLQAKADAALVRIHVQHHHLDFLTGRDDFTGVHVLFGPTHLGDMH